MEDKGNIIFDYFEEEEDYDDTLSFRNLPTNGQHDGGGGDSLQQSPRTSSAQELFEFFTGLTSETFTYPTQNLIFCGKIIGHENDNQLKNEYQKRDYLSLNRSASFVKPRNYQLLTDETDRFQAKNLSKSFRLSSSDGYLSKSSCSSSSSSVQKVNITSLTSMSAKSRRRMFMFGPVKFKPEMELTAIKERQGRRVPAPMFPASSGVEVVTSNGCGTTRTRGKSQLGNVARSLRNRSYIAAVLPRSFGCGCISMSVV
ncbi:unnamed protein product [Ilex paraguariensis]|uniref:Uncharacterized protein n=1 Tax=Ilex paraguariensis TaxID=185542 RepID=A0ABC8QTU2_9AQUA